MTPVERVHLRLSAMRINHLNILFIGKFSKSPLKYIVAYLHYFGKTELMRSVFSLKKPILYKTQCFIYHLFSVSGLIAIRLHQFSK